MFNMQKIDDGKVQTANNYRQKMGVNKPRLSTASTTTKLLGNAVNKRATKSRC